MSDDDYKSASVIKNRWPPWIPQPDGSHQRTWHFRFEESVSPTDQHLLDEPDISASITHPAPDSLVITTTTRGNAFSDELFFFASFRLFVKLEELYGRLKSIEGEDRSLWRPFRGTSEKTSDK